jgi:hypothetical protein
MKKNCLITMIVVFLLICTNGIQAQTPQTKLNQVELNKQFIGKWKGEIGKDTTLTFEIKSFGGGLEYYDKCETKGKIIYENKSLNGYDKKSDKYIGAAISTGSPYIVLDVSCFTSKNVCKDIPFEDRANPEKATWYQIFEFKSPDLLLDTYMVNNKVVQVCTFSRVKE